MCHLCRWRTDRNSGASVEASYMGPIFSMCGENEEVELLLLIWTEVFNLHFRLHLLIKMIVIIIMYSLNRYRCAYRDTEFSTHSVVMNCLAFVFLTTYLTMLHTLWIKIKCKTLWFSTLRSIWPVFQFYNCSMKGLFKNSQFKKR